MRIFIQRSLRVWMCSVIGLAHVALSAGQNGSDDAFTRATIQRDSRKVIRLSPSQKAVLFLSPNLNANDWRNGTVEQLTKINVRCSDSIRDGFTELTCTSIPATQTLPVKENGGPPPSARDELPQQRDFSIYSQKTKGYVKVQGKMVFQGATFAFYEDAKNPENFTGPEYDRINASLEKAHPKLLKVLGSPSDVDQNGAVIVFISHSLAELRDFGQAYMDAENLAGPGNNSGDYGEIIYITSLNHLRGAARGDLIESYYPRNILHEFVHLLQYAASIRKFGKMRGDALPAFYREGQAELVRWLGGFGVEDTQRKVVYQFAKKDQEGVSLFNYPYELGALFHWFLHERFGDGVSNVLLEKTFHSNPSDGDPISLAIPQYTEPMLVGLLHAAICFDGTQFGDAHQLGFSKIKLSESLKKAFPKVKLTGGQSIECKVPYTGCVTIEIDSSDTAFVELETSNCSFVVLVAQP